MIRARRSSPLALALAVTAACADARPDPAACADAAAAAACRRDAPLAGEYPAVDEPMRAWLAEDGAPPGCGLGVIVDGAVVHLRGHGLADRGAGRPFTLGTLSALGSVSKTITAIALHRLVAERGPEGPSLDDRLGDVLPAVPELLADVPLRRLLNHSAGLESLSYSEAYPSPYLDDDELGRLFPGEEHPSLWPRNTYWGLRERLVAGPPGTYANVNYHLVGAVLDYYADPDADAATIRGLTREATADGAFTDAAAAGYVAYTLDAVARAAPDPDDHLISMCPRTPWLPPLRALARGEGEAGVDDTDVAFTSGRIASGGWLMTIGDLARLVALIDRETLIPLAALTAEPAPITSVSLGPGNPRIDAGEGTWVMGHVFPDMSQATSIHHLGQVDGYTAYYRLTAATPAGAPSIGVALLCDGRVKNRVMVDRTEALVDAVYVDLAAHGAPSRAADPALAGCDDDDPG